MSRKCLFIAPHPDDESLGCGGTICKCAANGDEIYWLIVTSADQLPGAAQDAIARRENEIAKVAIEYGFKKTFQLKLPTTLLDNLPISEIVESIGSVIREVQPEVMFIPFPQDIHTDHRVVFNASWSCSKSFRYPSISEVYAYETLSETEFAAPIAGNGFLPNTYFDITHFLEKKCKIVNLFSDQVAPRPFPRNEESIRAQAALRGSVAGVSYAEAFICLKRII